MDTAITIDHIIMDIIHIIIMVIHIIMDITIHTLAPIMVDGITELQPYGWT